MSQEYIDARRKDYLEYLDSCSVCKGEFAVKLHLRHKCGECITKQLDQWKIEASIWHQFDKLIDRFEKFTERMFRWV